MADYYAVLSRTLAGFGAPKPQMREKLYDRARSTIRRQLESRNPPLETETFQKEMDSLEEAIKAIEADFRESDTTVPDTPSAAPPPVDPAPAVASGGEASGPPPLPPEQREDLTAPPPSPENSPSDVPVFDRRDATADVSPAKPVELPVFEPDITPVSDDPESETTTPPASAAALPKVSDPAVDAINEWAEEFLPEQEKENARSGTSESKDRQDAEARQPAKPAATLPAFDATPDETLIIPPAPTGASRDSSSGGIGRWVLIGLLILVALGAGATYAYWDEREELLASIGLGGLVGEEGVKPTPVKTITIKPDPVPEEQPDPEPEATAPEPTEPKSEDRLVADPVEPATEQTDPIAAEAVGDPPAQVAEDDAQSAAQNDDTSTAEAQEPSTTIEPAAAGEVPAVAQSAILYEEGSTASENRSDIGRVVWSRVEEPTGVGDATDPAIRARVEVPDRNLVMLMTLKRNLDRALPASHLIELVFAVPDDFSGGSIGNINRFVLKESEQGRGDALVGVPARIADGIFLIALNNLEQAKATNEGLLRQRSWIDIPMQYRTGRRALVTMEKGVPGEQVFRDVFAEWDKNQS